MTHNAIESLQEPESELPQVIREALPFAARQGIADARQFIVGHPDLGNPGEPAEFCLAYALSVARLTKRIVVGPTDSRFMDAMGGETYNPFRRLDLIGGPMFNSLYGNIQFADLPLTDIFIEEKGLSICGNTDDPRARLHGIIDPIDGSSWLMSPNKPITTGIAIFAHDGACIAGAIASLVDSRVLVSGNTTHHLFYNTEDYFDPFSPWPIPNDTTEDTGRLPMTYATHPRRIIDFPEFAGFRNTEFIWVEDKIGGWTNLIMEEGHLDLAMDPKGQPAYEELLWAGIGQKTGHPVITPNGTPLHMKPILDELLSGNPRFRVPYIMCRNEVVLDRAVRILTG